MINPRFTYLLRFGFRFGLWLTLCTLNIYLLTCVSQCPVCLLSAVDKVDLLQNVAVGRPAYQSTVLITDEVVAHTAKLANDGDHSTTLQACAGTAVTDINPWWTVHLAQPTSVYRVQLTFSDLQG